MLEFSEARRILDASWQVSSSLSFLPPKLRISGWRFSLCPRLDGFLSSPARIDDCPIPAMPAGREQLLPRAPTQH